jgi:Protein of unknown function (DUF3501)
VSGFQPEAVRLGDEYETVRDDARRALIDLKQPRRVQLGDGLSLVFENAGSVRAAAEESLRSERVSAPGAAAAHLDAFEAVAPGPGTVTAVLFLDSDDPAVLAERSTALRGVQRSVALDVGGMRVAGVPAELGDDAPAYHLTFAVPAEVRRRLADAAPVSVVVEHPGLALAAQLDGSQRDALLEDL